MVKQRQQRGFAFQLPEVFEGAAPRLQEQDEGIDKHGRGVAPWASGTGQLLISQGPQPQTVVILGQQGQTSVGGQGLVAPLQLEREHRLSYHGSHLAG